jgi:hypothetical protein
MQVTKSIRVSFVKGSGGRSDVVSSRGRSVSLLFCGFLVFLLLSVSPALRAADPPPPPPNPSPSSFVGQTVTNPANGIVTKVARLIVDPLDTPNPGTIAFVYTEDGFAILVKPVGAFIYNKDNPPLAYKIESKDTVNKTVQLSHSDLQSR